MKVISYQRVSTQAQDLKRQQALAEEFCEFNGHSLVRSIKEKISGAKEDRESINELLALTNEDCDLIVVSELSRITREDEYYKILYYIETIKKNGIDVHFLDNNTTYKHDEKFNLVDLITLIVGAHSANEERKKIYTRMSSGLTTMFKANPYMSIGTAPFGFDRINNPEYTDTNKAVPTHLIAYNELEVSYIQTAFQMVLEGKSSYDVARYFNSNGVSTKTGAKWSAGVVSRNILRNPLYKGVRTAKGITHKIKPIVSEDVFEAVNKQLTAKNCRKGNKNINLLKGLIFCADCGESMYLSSSRGNSAYRCMSAQKKRLRPSEPRKECHNGLVRASKLYDFVWECYQRYFKDSESAKLTATTIQSLNVQLVEMKKKADDFIEKASKLGEEINMVGKRMLAEKDDFIYNILKERFITLENTNKDYKTQAEIMMGNIEELIKQRDNLTRQNDISNMTDSEKQRAYREVIDRIFVEGHWTTYNVQIFFKNGYQIKATYK